MHATSGGFGDLGRLVAEAQTPLRTVELDVLSAANAGLYWGRDQAHDTVLDLSFAGAGLDALARLLESWIQHFLDIGVSIQPVQEIADEKWVWHIGLDAEATLILNDLYNGCGTPPAIPGIVAVGTNSDAARTALVGGDFLGETFNGWIHEDHGGPGAGDDSDDVSSAGHCRESNCGQMVVQTCLLPEREEPYLLNDRQSTYTHPHHFCPRPDLLSSLMTRPCSKDNRP